MGVSRFGGLGSRIGIPLRSATVWSLLDCVRVSMSCVSMVRIKSKKEG